MHCHLDLYPDPEAVVRDAESRGTYVLSVTTTPTAWQGTSRLARGTRRIRTALGLHPQLAQQRASEFTLFKALLPETRYVGEIGLDGSKEFRASLPTQIHVFERILHAVSDVGGRIMSIHSRGATRAVLESLQKFPGSGDFVLHWFSGTAAELQLAVEMGAWFSVGPAMLARRKGAELAALMPRSRVLTETDGPFGTMHNKVLAPWDATMAIVSLARIWQVSVSEASAEVMSTFRSLLSTRDTSDLLA